jgi:hypothetical protein
MRGNQAGPLLGFVLLSMLTVSLTGCGGHKDFTPDDFKKVQKDTPEDKVKEVLGKPFDSVEANGMKWTWWKVGDKYYRIITKEGRVTETSGPENEQDYKLAKSAMQMAPK